MPQYQKGNEDGVSLIPLYEEGWPQAGLCGLRVAVSIDPPSPSWRGMRVMRAVR